MRDEGRIAHKGPITQGDILTWGGILPSSLSWNNQSKFMSNVIAKSSSYFSFYLGWLALLTSCFIYNAWAIPLRQFFKIYHQPQHYAMWFCFDYLADLIYILDIVLFKYRVMFMKNGFWVKDRKELGKIQILFNEYMLLSLLYLLAY